MSIYAEEGKAGYFYYFLIAYFVQPGRRNPESWLTSVTTSASSRPSSARVFGLYVIGHCVGCVVNLSISRHVLHECGHRARQASFVQSPIIHGSKKNGWREDSFRPRRGQDRAFNFQNGIVRTWAAWYAKGFTYSVPYYRFKLSDFSQLLFCRSLAFRPYTGAILLFSIVSTRT